MHAPFVLSLRRSWLRGSRKRHREVFSRIYRENEWGSAESVSGIGSTRERADQFRPALLGLLSALGVRTLLDAPCGDFNWAEYVAGAVETYIGVDVVDELVDTNRRRHGSANRLFLLGDITRDPLPKSDLILCRDALVHFSFADIWASLDNFRRSGAEYLLTTTFCEKPANINMRSGGWRVLNLEAAPFHFPPPMQMIDEHCTHSGGGFRDKRLALWPMHLVPR
jgi:hypothetical protein